jgi:hypothetical protein
MASRNLLRLFIVNGVTYQSGSQRGIKLFFVTFDCAYI